FYYMATARRVIDENRARLAAGNYPHPEQTFLALYAAVEQAKKLRKCADTILRKLGLDPKLPKHPQKTHETIRLYRNALAHDPVLGRAVGHQRELLPPEDLLPKEDRLLLWSKTAMIPKEKMVDGQALQERLWREFAVALQELWSAMAREFIAARENEMFRA